MQDYKGWKITIGKQPSPANPLVGWANKLMSPGKRTIFNVPGKTVEQIIIDIKRKIDARET